MKSKKMVFGILLTCVSVCIIVALFFLSKILTANATSQWSKRQDTQPEYSDSAKFYLTINADNVFEIGITTPSASGGCTNANGSLFKKGDSVWLESLDGFSTLNEIQVTAFDVDGNAIWSASIPDVDTCGEITQFSKDGWVIVAK